MQEKVYQTRCGNIHYFVNLLNAEAITLVFLPGLTADHRLFDKQVAYFEGKMNIFMWDAPSHALSRPFTYDYTLEDKARWLCEILEQENIQYPVIVGQSMGGYVGQEFCELFPTKLKGFISIDSAPLQRFYMTGFEIWLMEHTEPIYRYYPWKSLLKAGSEGVAFTEYGRKLMFDMMMDYNENPKEYARLAGHGYKMLARAVKADLPYEIKCPALLICGKQDRAGSTVNYNKRWHEKTKLPIAWIENAGHNSNSDQPEEINQLIKNFVENIA